MEGPARLIIRGAKVSVGMANLLLVNRDPKADPATERLIACIEDGEFAARYPGRTHFISADDPHQGTMAVGALCEGDPVALVYCDGYELLIRPDGDPGSAKPRLGISVEARDADAKPISVGEVIDAIPTAWERTQEGLAEAARGAGVSLDDLA
jgi:hypothetical protein